MNHLVPPTQKRTPAPLSDLDTYDDTPLSDLDTEDDEVTTAAGPEELQCAQMGSLKGTRIP